MTGALPISDVAWSTEQERAHLQEDLQNHQGVNLDLDGDIGYVLEVMRHLLMKFLFTE